MITKEIKVSSIPTPDVWRKKDDLLAQGFKHVNNIRVRGSDRFTMIFTKD